MTASSEEPVALTVVANESEAEMLCGLLRSNGIRCGHRVTEALDSRFEEFKATGPREILVDPADLERARAVLPPAR